MVAARLRQRRADEWRRCVNVRAPVAVLLQGEGVVSSNFRQLPAYIRSY